jgi:hypothetical protein
MEQVEKSGDRHAPQAELEANVTPQEDVAEPPEKKHYSFYLSILMLSMIGMIVAWDVTALSLALPVSFPLPQYSRWRQLSN